MLAWLASSLRRYFPVTQPEDKHKLTLHAARGEKRSFQAVFNIGDIHSPMMVTAEVDTTDSLEVSIRRVGCVPLPHFNTDTPTEELDGPNQLPGFVPDPLFPENSIVANPEETYAFWITVTIPTDAPVGSHEIHVTLTSSQAQRFELITEIIVHEVSLQPRRNFFVSNFFHADTVCQRYGIELWEDSFWEIFESYVKNLAAHGQDAIYVPLFTPPLDGIKRPTQLVRLRKCKKGFDFLWEFVRRWVDISRKHGIRLFQWSHLFTQWGAQNAIRVYEGNGEDDKLLWPANTAALAPVYRDFLAYFLPKLRRFLQRENLVKSSLFHLSDEPHLEHLPNYLAAREMIREVAPWMRTIDALSDPQFVQRGLVDVPVPIVQNAPEFVKKGFNPWVYYCCLPRGRFLNRLLDTPLVKIRMSGWLFYRTKVRGFLHWGYNYWYKRATTELIDPFTVSDGGAWPDWAHGDPFVVYPGENGPLDSIRWEVFAESLQDYALLQQAGIDPDDPMLSEIKDYADFPRSEDWIKERRKEVLDSLDNR